MVESAGWALPGAEVSIAHNTLLFKYVCASDFVRKRLSDSIEAVVIYVVDEVSTAESGDAACCTVLCRRASTGEVRYYAS